MSVSVLDHGFVEVLDHMGTDLTVVNAARVSFGKWKDKFDEKDAGLIRYLADHEHTTPFRHCAMTFHIKAPIFLLRQFMRHNVGISWSEISGRYVDMGEADIHWPEVFRGAADNVKQGSGGPLEFAPNEQARYLFRIHADNARTTYRKLINLGVCKEQAREVLPLALYSEVHVTFTLQALAHFCHLRVDGHAQQEAQAYAKVLFQLGCERFPVALPYLAGLPKP